MAGPILNLPDHVLGPTAILQAVPSDLLYIDALQRKLVNNTGFVPRTAIADHLERGDYQLVNINGQPTGYAMHGGGIRKPYRLIQVAIDPEAWRHGLGTVLIILAWQKANTKPKPNMTATVRAGLPMNEVVTATGAIPIARDETPTARGKDRILYRWPG